MRIYSRNSFQPAASDKGMFYPRRMPGGGGPVPPFNPYPNAVITLVPASFQNALYNNNPGSLSCGYVQWNGAPMPGINGYSCSIPANLNLTYPQFVAYLEQERDDWVNATGVTLGQLYLIDSESSGVPSSDDISATDYLVTIMSAIDSLLDNNIPLPTTQIGGALSLNSGSDTDILYFGQSVSCGVSENAIIEVRLPRIAISISYV